MPPVRVARRHQNVGGYYTKLTLLYSSVTT